MKCVHSAYSTCNADVCVCVQVSVKGMGGTSELDLLKAVERI